MDFKFFFLSVKGSFAKIEWLGSLPKQNNWEKVMLNNLLNSATLLRKVICGLVSWEHLSNGSGRMRYSIFLLRIIIYFPSISLNEILQNVCHHNILTMEDQDDFLLQPSQSLLCMVLSFVLIRKQTSSVKFTQGTKKRMNGNPLSKCVSGLLLVCFPNLTNLLVVFFSPQNQK